MWFKPGRTVVRRYFKRGQMLSVVKTGRVVQDDDRGLVLWIPGGSPVAWLRLADGRGLHDVRFPEWVAARKKMHRQTWQGYGVLVLVPPDAAHSVWWFWNEDGAFDHWYINLELPSTRWDDGELAGVDTVDHDLDVVAWPNGSWEFKDEDEFAERLAYPEHYWVDDEAAVRAEAARVISIFEARRYPFDGSWCDFRPPPSWTTPSALPAGWDRPRAGMTPTGS
ncbi:MAG: DUF402 domain-containing protein [Micromonosporaceae bacterium]|jgi:hypothetical protein|nr:DUF402 domain-containing protein [Micromonosporaceae bacterium]